MQTTGNPLDFAIQGRGFFKMTDPGGDFLYTRAGNFGINATGQLVLGSAHTGWVVGPAVTIPPEAVDVVVTADGQVQYRTTDTRCKPPANSIWRRSSIPTAC